MKLVIVLATCAVGYILTHNSRSSWNIGRGFMAGSGLILTASNAMILVCGVSVFQMMGVC